MTRYPDLPTKAQVVYDQVKHRLTCAICGKPLAQPGDSPAVRAGIEVYQHKECGG